MMSDAPVGLFALKSEMVGVYEVFSANACGCGGLSVCGLCL